MKIAVFGKRRQNAEDLPRIASLMKILSDRGIFVAVQRHFYEAMTRELGMLWRLTMCLMRMNSPPT